MSVLQIDKRKAEAFSERLIDFLNGGAMALMISIGHRTGLFDIMSQLPSSSSEEIAERAGLNERYVREWLNALTVGRILEVDTSGDVPRYSLPREHAVSLTRAAGADNIGVFAQYIGVLGSVEDRIVECFYNGGGVSYEEYKRFHDVMAEDSGQSVLSSLFKHILPLIPGITEQMEQGIDVLDIGCGQGRALIQMAQKYPNSYFTGYDLNKEPIDKARAEVKRLGLTNVRFEQKDLTNFPVKGKYHFVTAFDAIHDQARPDKVLAGVYRVLHPGGFFLMQDIAGSAHVHNNFDHPIGPLLYTISCMHCMTVSLAQNGWGLGAMWGKETALKMLNEAGFKKIDVKSLDHDFQNYYYVIQKD